MRLANCPHCGTFAKVYSTRKISALTVEQYVACTNVAECDTKFVVRCEIAYTIRPSLKPNPKVILPLSPRAAPPAAAPVPANDEVAPAVAEG